jgi:uncharacterized protein
MIPRNILPSLQRAMSLSPVVLLQGARQTGKSTLVQTLTQINGQPTRYISLDEASLHAAAVSDPTSFVAAFNSSNPSKSSDKDAKEVAVLDEVQRAPELFQAIKVAVDKDRRPGRFLLTGSANALMLPRLSESLAGRIHLLTLRPFAQDELEWRTSTLVDRLFTGKIKVMSTLPLARKDLLNRALRGGYPFLAQVTQEADRHSLFNSYITSILQRDVRDMANIEGLTQMPRLLALIASRSSALLNVSDLARAIGIPHPTLNRYLALLEATFLVWRLPAWSNNLGSRLSKTPKLMISDTGLMASLLVLGQQRLLNDPNLTGIFFETFVANEFAKLASWSAAQPSLFHFQVPQRGEVDLVLEGPGGDVVGIEVKAAASVGPSDFKGLNLLAQVTGKRFVRGVVLYTGERIVPFGDNLLAVPMSALWTEG